MYKFYIINTTVFKLYLDGTHILSNRKFAKGFEQYGYEVVEILKDSDIPKIENNTGNIIILSNFIDFQNDWQKIVDFGKKYNNLFYILWCWHCIPNPPFNKWIYTFQEYKLEPSKPKFKEEYNLFLELEKQKKFIPYRFASYIDPLSNFKELNNIQKIYDIVYIGSPYEMDCINLIKENSKYKSFIHINGGGNNAIVGEEFEKIYRQSKICLGFMHFENNDKNTITERIWEAFSFGSLVITNSKTAELITEGTAIYYRDMKDLINKIEFYLSNDKERKIKIEKGYDIFTNYGNYKYNAKEFIDFINI